MFYDLNLKLLVIFAFHTGGNGAVYGDKSTSEITHFPTIKVKVVDTTVIII